ncbi:MAG: AAA family ATPase, partial [Victivallales bacterium]|nr:AAA family ATPase [Victivallales bacterium]
LEKSTVVRSYDVIMQELNEKYVGLASVKEHIMLLANRIRIGRLRANLLSVPASSGNNHTCLLGNVGTGKKSMAKYMAEIFCALGIVAHPKLRIWRGVDLKGSYVGQTKDKVNKMFEDSADSVVLIDEIYGLVPEGLSSQDSFGMEAVDAIAGGLSDAKNATTILLLSGNEAKLEKFLASNPQLANYFSQSIRFPDYTDAECLEILKRRLAEEHYLIPEEQLEAFEKKILSRLVRMRRAAGVNFGNAFAVNGIFNQMMDARCTRFGELLDEKRELTAEMLKNIDVEKDLPESGKEA